MCFCSISDILLSPHIPRSPPHNPTSNGYFIEKNACLEPRRFPVQASKWVALKRTHYQDQFEEILSYKITSPSPPN
jgi:hypothetical protein